MQPLPLLSFVAFILLLGIVLNSNSGSDAIVLGFCCITLSWLCSVACGWYAVKRKETTFPKLIKVSMVLLGLSLLSLIISVLAIGFGIMESLALHGIMWCLASCFITLYVIVRDVKDFHTWILFFTQILWIAFSFYFHYITVRIAGSI